MDQWNKVTNIDDCVALVTGARIKIGYPTNNNLIITIKFIYYCYYYVIILTINKYYIALRLLRCGVTVIAVTRFPHDASLRYSNEPDFNNWKDKLHIPLFLSFLVSF